MERHWSFAKAWLFTPDQGLPVMVPLFLNPDEGIRPHGNGGGGGSKTTVDA